MLISGYRDRKSTPQSSFAPVIKNRMLQSIPGQEKGAQTDAWLLSTHQEAMVFLSETGTKKDGKKAPALLNLLRRDGIISSRAGSFQSPVFIGESTKCVDYSSHPVAAGPLHLVGIDFGDKPPHE